jgi:hypothetical protein
MIDDLESGRNIRESAKERFDEAKRDAVSKITGGQVGTGCGLKRKSKLQIGGARKKQKRLHKGGGKRRIVARGDFFD